MVVTGSLTAGRHDPPAPRVSADAATPSDPFSATGARWAVVPVGVAILATFLIPSDSVIRAIGAMGFPGGLAAIALLGLWGCLVATRIHRPWHYRNPTSIILTLFVMSSLIGYVVTHLGSPTASIVRAADRVLMLNAACAGIILCIAQGANTRRAIGVVMDVVLLGAAFSALVALVDSLTGAGIAAALKTALPGFSLNSEYESISTREGVARVSGIALHAIEFGVVSSMAMCLGYARVLVTRGFGRVARALLTGLVALAVPLSVSRSAVLATAVAVGVLLALSPWGQRVRLIATGILAVAAVGMAVPRLVSALVQTIQGSAQDSSIAARVFDYEPFLRSFALHPWFGTGVSSYKPTTAWDILDNQYLAWLLERGAIGALGPLVLMVAPFLVALTLHRRSRDPELSRYAAALAAGLLIALLLSGTFDSFSFPMFVIAYCVFVGLLGACWVNAQRPAGAASPAGGS